MAKDLIFLTKEDQDQAQSITSWDNVLTSGFFMFSNNSQGGVSIMTPDSKYGIQIIVDINLTYVQSRTRNNGAWTAWKYIYPAKFTS